MRRLAAGAVVYEALGPLLARVGAGWVARQRSLHRPDAGPLSVACRRSLAAFFPEWILDATRVRVVERLEPPAWLEALARAGVALPLELDRVAGIAFVDTVVVLDAVPEPRRPALLFHELVHVVQYHVLGVRGFVDRYVRGWMAAGRRYREIPLETDAHALAARFAGAPGEPFDVVAEVERRLAGDPEGQGAGAALGIRSGRDRAG